MMPLSEQEEFELLSLEREKALASRSKALPRPKNTLQLQQEHNLNREAEAQQAFQPIKNTGGAIADLLRTIGSVAGKTPVVGGLAAAAGEAGGQAVEMAAGSREKFNPQAVGTSGAVSAASFGLGPLLSTLAGRAKAGAAHSISQVFGPTKETTKFITKEKLVPEVLKRRIVASSRESLEAKAAQSAEDWGKALEQAYSGLPQGASVKPEPIIAALEKAKDKFFTVEKGVKVQLGGDIERQAVKQLSKMQDAIADLASVPNTATLFTAGGKKIPILNDVSIESMRKLRQKLDDTVAKAGGFAGKDIKVQNQLWARREAANSIRREISKEYPEIAKINAEFSFWQNMDDVLSATQLRTQSQSTPLTRQLFRLTGAIGGAAGGGIQGTVIGLATAEALSRAFSSTAWRTVSGQSKNLLSKMLADGKTQEAAILATRLVAGKTVTALQEK